MTLDGVPRNVLRAFGATEPAVALEGGEGRTFRSGGIVLRRENPGDEDDAVFNAELLSGISAISGFRVATPLRTLAGDWMGPGGWTAAAYVAGRAATRDDASAIVACLLAFHAALAPIPRPPHLARRDNAYQRADEAAFGARRRVDDARLDGLLGELYELRRDVTLPQQLIHGDANQDNILIADGEPPAIIDLALYWRPVQFAFAVSAFWLGPYRGDASVLVHYAHVPQFEQMLLRALIRSLYAALQFPGRDIVQQYGPAVDVVLALLRR